MQRSAARGEGRFGGIVEAAVPVCHSANGQPNRHHPQEKEQEHKQQCLLAVLPQAWAGSPRPLFRAGGVPPQRKQQAGQRKQQAGKKSAGLCNALCARPAVALRARNCPQRGKEEGSTRGGGAQPLPARGRLAAAAPHLRRRGAGVCVRAQARSAGGEKGALGERVEKIGGKGAAAAHCPRDSGRGSHAEEYKGQEKKEEGNAPAAQGAPRLCAACKKTAGIAAAIGVVAAGWRGGSSAHASAGREGGRGQHHRCVGSRDKKD